jgi:hypothetical protein
LVYVPDLVRADRAADTTASRTPRVWWVEKSHRCISGALHKAVRIGAAGAVFLALAAPFSAVPSALADLGHKSPPPPSLAYNVTLSCMLSDVSGATTPTGRGIKVAPAGGCSRAGPSILGSSIEARCTWTSVTFSGTQPANVDTLFVSLEINLGGCGGLAGKTISFTPRFSLSLA